MGPLHPAGQKRRGRDPPLAAGAPTRPAAPGLGTSRSGSTRAPHSLSPRAAAPQRPPRSATGAAPSPQRPPRSARPAAPSPRAPARTFPSGLALLAPLLGAPLPLLLFPLLLLLLAQLPFSFPLPLQLLKAVPATNLGQLSLHKHKVFFFTSSAFCSNS